MAPAPIGERFGKLVVVAEGERDTNCRAMLCVCDCGERATIKLKCLRAGDNKSCGCTIIRYDHPLERSQRRVYRAYAESGLGFPDFVRLASADCFYCGCPPSNRANALREGQRYRPRSQEDIAKGEWQYSGLDRVDNAEGHTASNCVPCCYPCNRAKMQQSAEAFVQLCNRVARKHPLPEGDIELSVESRRRDI